MNDSIRNALIYNIILGSGLVIFYKLNLDANYLNYYLTTLGFLTLTPIVKTIKTIFKIDPSKSLITIARILFFTSSFFLHNYIEEKSNKIGELNKIISDKYVFSNNLKDIISNDLTLEKIDSIQKLNKKISLNQTEYKVIEGLITAKVDKKAKSLFHNGEFEESIKYADYLIKKNINRPDLYFLVGNAFLNLDDKYNAIKYFGLSKEYGNQEAESIYETLNPLRKKISHYVTLCCDGTYSYSTGRGTCSWHNGVCQWNYPIYTTYRDY